MTEKTEDQIARERASVEAMKNAKANMATVLDRVETLERALRHASGTIGTLKGFIAPSAYQYPVGGSARKCTDIADDAMAAINKVLS
jgi:ABC-type transporter Mla subunit MlaD